jgi:hypothetical protein
MEKRMNKLNNKDQMLKQIAHLTKKMELVYEAGQEGISYVGTANYPDRESSAHRKLQEVYYSDKHQG